jgi:endonuclease-3
MSSLRSSSRLKKTEAPVEIKEEQEPISSKKKRGTVETKEESQEEEEPSSSKKIKTSEEAMSGPRNWQAIYAGIKEFRRLNNRAAVDTDGCHMLAAFDVDPKTRRYQILVALQLSSQTKDEVNSVAMKNLRNHFGDDGFTADAVIKVDAALLDSLICKV